MISPTRFIQSFAACGALSLLAGCSTGGSSGGAFPVLDTDHNGAGSHAEFNAYMKQETFARVDANKDTKVTLQEWQAANPQVDAAKFRKTDGNHDGTISRAESDAAFDREGSLGRLFNWVDTNGDASLSQAEVTTYGSLIGKEAGHSQIEKLSNAAAKP